MREEKWGGGRRVGQERGVSEDRRGSDKGEKRDNIIKKDSSQNSRVPARAIKHT